MGRQRNKSQMKVQENFSEEKLSEMEASNLSDIEFRVMIISMLNSMKKKHRKHKKGQVINNAISELNNTLEGINSRLDESEDEISNLENKVEKQHPIGAAKRKKI